MRLWPFRCLVAAAALLLPLSCAPQLAPPPKVAQPAAPAPASEWKQVEPGKQKVSLVPNPAGVPAPDATCQAFAGHPAAPCPVSGAARDALALALNESDPLERDNRLSCLEAAPEIAPGLVRALRAELAPVACADVLSLPFLEPRKPGLDRRVEDALIALAAAGKLSRLVRRAPELSAPFDKP